MAVTQAAWGLDVGITSLKAIKLRRDGDKVAVEAFEVIDHDKFLSEPDVDRDDLIRHTLRKFLERNPVRRELVFVGVPGSSTFARFVKLPPVETKKIPEIVRFEAIQQIPFPLDQVNWDYQTFINPESPDVEVGIFAMKKELVGQVLANFRSTGMTVHGVQMSPLAVYNAAAYDGLTDGKGTVVIDMGAEHTDLVIMDQGRLWLRTINIGGNHFTDALSKSFKQSFSRAEALKKTAATSKYQKQIFQAMRPIFADLVAEIQRSIGHYNSSHRDSKLERIVGMGNPFKLPNLQKYLQQELKMEVLRLDNFRKANTDPKTAAALNETILSMTAAYGLAVQGLGLASIDTNLLPVEIARQMMWRHKRPWFYAAAAVMVLAAGMWEVQSYQSNSAFAAAEAAGQPQNDTLIAEETTNLNHGRNEAKLNENDEKEVDQLLKLPADRAILPMITQDYMAALPQAKRGAANQAGPTIVLTQITSEYTAKLSTAAAPVAQTSGEASGESGERGGFRGGWSPGRSSWSPGRGAGVNPAAPQPVQPTPAPSANETSAPAGPADRGFTVMIQGYVQPQAGVEGYEVVGNYVSAIVARAPEKGNKPYYFVRGAKPYTGTRFESDPSTLADQGIWGKGQHGDFYDVFAPDVTGIKLQEKPGAGGGAPEVMPMGPLPALDLFAIRNANPQPNKRLDGSFIFTINLKVFIKDESAAATGH